MLTNFDPNKVTVTSKTGVTYYNIPNAYDIETSSFYIGEQKHALTYSHMFSINGEETHMRTDEEFMEYINGLGARFNTRYKEKHLVIYVHNLQYEFQFIKHLLDWAEDSVFVISSKRKVVKAVTTSGIEFRCSHILTNKSLANWAKDLGLKKLMGDLNYELVRTPLTPLMIGETSYIREDVRIIIAGITELLKEDDIASIPMTSTGYVRRAFRKHVMQDLVYKKKIKELTIELEEYELLKIAYSGGLTRANSKYAGQVVSNVAMFDENSEYPAEQVTKKFPMSKGKKVTNISSLHELEEKCKKYCVLMTVELSNVESIRDYTLISQHKVSISGNKIIDNGRVVYADKVVCTITDVDYKQLKKYYDFQVTNIGTCYIYKAGYLPKPFVEMILELYANKTTLKNVVGAEDLYNKSKERLNGVYGMSVSTPIHGDTFYDSESGMVIEIPQLYEDKMDAIEKHNTSYNRFLFYPWGVWTTAYARESLMMLNEKIEDAGIKDYYSDTDSRYLENTPETFKIVEEMNEIKRQELEQALNYHNIPLEQGFPVDPSGEVQPLGLWDHNPNTDVYDEFKTLGAKRYMCRKGDNYYITISGLNKKASRWIKGAGGFDYFKDKMYIPDYVSGRKSLTYIDYPQSGIVTDYLGQPYEFETYSSVHMERSGFTMTLSPEYKEFLQTMQNKENQKSKY